jgi:glycosyltransferase involved in cell wall biosynthesis
MITAVILTKNNEIIIKDLVSSLNWCSEVIVIDSLSEDKTAELIKKAGAKFYQRKLEKDFSKQRNFGLKKAKFDWVLFVDADEWVTSELKKEIITHIRKEKYKRDKDKINGFFLKRRDFFLNKWLKHGETASLRLLRLGRKEAGKWQGKVHETWIVKGKTKTLKNPLLHRRSITISQFIKRINFYSSLRAKELRENKEKLGFWQIVFFPAGKFLQNYFLRLGFLDGFPGFIMAAGMSLHSFLVRIKYYFRIKGK